MTQSTAVNPSREFKRLETWDKFLEKWGKNNITEQEAVSLLYVGIDVPFPWGSPWYQEVEQVKKRVDFYLDCAAMENYAVASVAQELIVKHWMKKIAPLSAQRYCLIHESLLRFLRPPHASLLTAPYPRFVSQYLLAVHQFQFESKTVWEHLKEPFVLALLEWGLGYVLARDSKHPEYIEIIQKFLRERKYDPGQGLFRLSGLGEPLENVGHYGAQEEISKRAAFTLFKLQYWVGEGVHEKFDRRAP